MAELLNPAGSHGQGNLFLRGFLELFHEPDQQQFPLPEKDLSRGRWIVLREMGISSGFIDIVIRNVQLGCLYIVENKIWAAEQPLQIARYQEWLATQSNYPNRAIIFLTPTGRAPQTGSAFCLSYREDIKSWLEQSLEIIEAVKVKETIRQYLSSLPGAKEETMAYEETVLKFLGQPENITTAFEIAAYVEKLKPQLVWHFWNSFNKGLDALYQDSTYRDSWKLLKIAKKDTDRSWKGCFLLPLVSGKVPDVSLLRFGFQQHDQSKGGNFYYGIRWSKGRDTSWDNSSPELTALHDQLRAENIKSSAPNWPAFTWVGYSPKGVSFFVKMTNEPDEFVNEWVDKFWKQFLAYVPAVEAVNRTLLNDPLNKKSDST